MEKADLWTVIQEKKQEEPLQEVVDTLSAIKDSLPEDIKEVISEKKYVIHAYINKATGKQVYLSGWDDSPDWMLSTVPYATSKEKCEKLIEKAQKQIERANSEKKITTRFPKDIKFNIIEVCDEGS